MTDKTRLRTSGFRKKTLQTLDQLRKKSHEESICNKPCSVAKFWIFISFELSLTSDFLPNFSFSDICITSDHM